MLCCHCHCHHHHHHPFHLITSQFCKERSWFSFCFWEEGKTQDPSSRKICKLSFYPLSISFSQPLRTPFPCFPTQYPHAALSLSKISLPGLPKQSELWNYLSHFFSFSISNKNYYLHKMSSSLRARWKAAWLKHYNSAVPAWLSWWSRQLLILGL